jgi:hypothetical protein
VGAGSGEVRASGFGSSIRSYRARQSLVIANEVRNRLFAHDRKAGSFAPGKRRSE